MEILLVEDNRTAPIWLWFSAMPLLAIVLRSGAMYRFQFRRIKAIQQPVHFEAAETGAVDRTSKGESKTSWEGFEKWLESDKVFLLYLQPRMFLVIPKRVLGLDEISDLRKLMKAHIHERLQ